MSAAEFVSIVDALYNLYDKIVSGDATTKDVFDAALQLAGDLEGYIDKYPEVALYLRNIGGVTALNSLKDSVSDYYETKKFPGKLYIHLG